MGRGLLRNSGLKTRGSLQCIPLTLSREFACGNSITFLTNAWVPCISDKWNHPSRSFINKDGGEKTNSAGGLAAIQ